MLHQGCLDGTVGAGECAVPGFWGVLHWGHVGGTVGAKVSMGQYIPKSSALRSLSGTAGTEMSMGWDVLWSFTHWS